MIDDVEGKEISDEIISKMIEAYQNSQSLESQNESRQWLENAFSSNGLK